MATVTLDSLQIQINNLQENLNTQNTRLNSHLNECESEIQEQNQKIALLNNEDSEIHDEINLLATELDNVDGRVEAIETKNYQNQIDALEQADSTLADSIDALDDEVHEEIHLLAIGLENVESRVDVIESKDYQGQIDTLEQVDEALEEAMEEMNTDIHEEMHLLAIGLDNSNSAILNLQIKQAEYPDQEVLSESEYERIGTPEFNKIYFVYEDN